MKNRNKIYVFVLSAAFLVFNNAFAQAGKISPNDAEAYKKEADNYQSTGYYDFAIEDYTRAIELNPNDAEAYCKRGDAYKSQLKISQAINDYNKAIEINPNYAQAYKNLGSIYYKQGNLSRALSSYIKALKIDPNDAEAENMIYEIQLPSDEDKTIYPRGGERKNKEHRSNQ